MTQEHRPDFFVSRVGVGGVPCHGVDVWLSSQGSYMLRLLAADGGGTYSHPAQLVCCLYGLWEPFERVLGMTGKTKACLVAQKKC